jgi:hypothetical protein
VIRFNCPHCGRLYELPEALARLALVCKGCGQPLPVPEKSTAAESPPPALPTLPPLPPLPALPPLPPVSARAPSKPSAASLDAPKTPPLVVVAAGENRLPPPDKLITNGPPAAYPMAEELFETPDALAVLEDAWPTPPPARPVEPSERKSLGAVVDVVVALVLVAVGVFCGEVLARQSTGDVLKDAASAAKFPPVDLLMWLSPILLLLLVYALLVSRGKSVGSFIRRRTED